MVLRVLRHGALVLALTLASVVPALADGSDWDYQVIEHDIQQQSMVETVMNNVSDAWSEMTTGVTDNMGGGDGGGCCDWGSGWGW